MGNSELPHQPCPFENCGSSDAFSWSEEGYGLCHSCRVSYPSKGMPKVFEWVADTYPTKQKEEPKMVKEVASVTYEGIRGLLPEVAKLYKIQRHMDEDGEWVRDAYGYPDNVKYRTPEKQFTWKERGKSPLDLFGPDFNAGSSKKMYLTEGEYDAASLYQVLGQGLPVKSLPSGSIGDKFVKHNHHYLKEFEQIIYAGELDDTGRKAADRLYQAYPEKFYYVPMSKWKDANEFLTEGDASDLKWAALKPQRYSPDNFFCSDADVEHAILTENPYEYVPTGHEELDDKVRGLVKGGITFIKAQRGTGKTELCRYFEIGLLKNSESKVALLHMEEQKSTTYRSMATYELGVNVRTKEDAVSNGVTEQEVIAAAKKVTQGDRTILFEMRAADDPMKVLEYIKLAVGVYGAEFVMIDHIQRLAYLSSGGVDSATSMLTALGSQAAQLAKEFNVGIIFISQVNQEGRTKYASALEEEAIICLDLTRDVESDDEMVRNTTDIKVSKNRPFAKLGTAGALFYDPETTLIREATFDV